jgi:hypothetical protein
MEDQPSPPKARTTLVPGALQVETVVAEDVEVILATGLIAEEAFGEGEGLVGMNVCRIFLRGACAEISEKHCGIAHPRHKVALRRHVPQGLVPLSEWSRHIFAVRLPVYFFFSLVNLHPEDAVVVEGWTVPRRRT